MSNGPLLSAGFRHVVFPADVPRRKKLVNFAAPDEPPPAPPRPGLGLGHESAAFVGWLFERAGLRARQYRPETLQRRLPACLRVLRAGTPAEARRLLEHNPTLLAPAISAMLVGVTAFFRDALVFDQLAREVLPDLTRSRPALHVWSAGCSDGAELYSVALLLAELGRLKGSYLLGTDCRPDALARAREGLFEPAAVKDVAPLLLARYFVAEEDGWRVVPWVRACLRWRTADVLRTQEPGVWDVILCRNTTMYLCSEAARALWERFEAGLRPGGVLVLGKAERPLGAKRLSPLGLCVYRRNRG